MLRLGVHVMRSNAASVMSYAVCRMQRQEFVDVSNFTNRISFGLYKSETFRDRYHS